MPTFTSCNGYFGKGINSQLQQVFSYFYVQNKAHKIHAWVQAHLSNQPYNILPLSDKIAALYKDNKNRYFSAYCLISFVCPVDMT